MAFCRPLGVGLIGDCMGESRSEQSRSVLLLRCGGLSSESAGSQIFQTGNHTWASLPLRIVNVVGREENLLWTRDLRGFTWLQQEAPAWSSSQGRPTWELHLYRAHLKLDSHISAAGWQEIRPLVSALENVKVKTMWMLGVLCAKRSNISPPTPEQHHVVYQSFSRAWSDVGT